MNKLTREKRVRVIAALVEGNSIRATVRMTGVAKNTVSKLLCDIGQACERYHDRVMADLPCKRLQVDEIWSFCYAKQKNVPEPLKGTFGYGDVWTWVAIDADTKLVPQWLVGLRTAEWADAFIGDLAYRLKNRVQLTSDGLKVYLNAVEEVFGGEVDYATLVKIYGSEKSPEEPITTHKYSPGQVTGCQLTVIQGKPDPRHISTSYVERQNLTMRMSMRRFTRLTNGFSKKVENLSYAVALHFVHYNFCRIHQSLRMTPAMKAKVTDHLWDLDELVDLIDQ
ncbi:IS1 family transposase [Anaerobaca lacustris]|uniref:IS1 family transposase n=1 Tax=Anaerobaca lacustris TaxID=3044600 RepID=A0AAW6TUX8_9BACT|nr:IS1 family transposase [Sedimentisphaerales bacterium M17dextr]